MYVTPVTDVCGPNMKEGWPDHLLIMIQMLVPAGVVDCCGFPSSSIACSITQPQQKWTCS